MTAQEWATRLEGRQYREELSTSEARMLAQEGLVVAFGASDDLLELRGALDGEYDAYNGITLLLTSDGIFDPSGCPSECRYFMVAKQQADTHGVRLEALWDAHGYSWWCTIAIPHATFTIVEGKELFCRGIVFALADVAKAEGDTP